MPVFLLQVALFFNTSTGTQARLETDLIATIGCFLQHEGLLFVLGSLGTFVVVKQWPQKAWLTAKGHHQRHNHVELSLILERGLS